MIEVEFIRFAVFNVADIFVVCGGILLAVYGIFIWKDPKDKEKEQAAKPEENRDETNS
jgi:signal peptidase II